MRGLLLLIIATSVLNGCHTGMTAEEKIRSLTPFGVCYTKVTPAMVAPYNMVIVEPDFYTQTEVKALQGRETSVLAYVTLGEVDPNRWYFKEMEDIGFRGKNEVWNSFYVDVSDTAITNMILDQVIPEVMNKGFDGLFMDTIDAVSPETKRGDLQEPMAELIQSIREQYPEKVIIQNAGLFLLDETGPFIDAFLTESLASNYDFEQQVYQVRPDSVYNTRLGYLNEYVEKTGVPFFVLDYADTGEKVGQLKSRLDTLGNPYFISNIALSKLPNNVDSLASPSSTGGL